MVSMRVWAVRKAPLIRALRSLDTLRGAASGRGLGRGACESLPRRTWKRKGPAHGRAFHLSAWRLVSLDRRVTQRQVPLATRLVVERDGLVIAVEHVGHARLQRQ